MILFGLGARSLLSKKGKKKKNAKEEKQHGVINALWGEKRNVQIGERSTNEKKKTGGNSCSGKNHVLPRSQGITEGSLLEGARGVYRYGSSSSSLGGGLDACSLWVNFGEGQVVAERKQLCMLEKKLLVKKRRGEEPGRWVA